MAWRKTFHQSNPCDMAKWSAMTDSEPRDFYLINPGHVIATIADIRPAKVHGRDVLETIKGENILHGSIVPAKAFGPCADLQRHVDNGAIRQATYEEVEGLRANFAENAGRTGTEVLNEPLTPEGQVKPVPREQGDPVGAGSGRPNGGLQGNPRRG